MVKPKIAKEKYSAGPNFKAALASGPEKKTRMSAPKKPPTVEAMTEAPSALPGLPCLVKG